MTTTFRPGLRENVGLWINLIGGTGSGKTFTGMRLASGIAGDKPFAVIDTENRRALHYADRFRFDHAQLRAPFRPDAYAEPITAADQAGYRVIVVDSGSHVWSGDGGVLDWHEEILEAMVRRAKDRGDSRSEWQIREAGNLAAWIKPKMSHHQMVNKMLQCRAHLILCLRAEPKIEMVKGKDGKWAFQEKQSRTGRDGWIPLCEKALPFEATCSFLFMEDKPGVPLPIKLQEQHKALFPLDKPITEESGRLIAQWAAGGSATQNQPSGVTAAPAAAHEAAGSPATEYINPDDCLALEALCTENGIPIDNLKKAAQVTRLAQIKAVDLKRARDWITAAIERRKSK